MTDSATLYMATIRMEKKEEEEYSIWIQRGKERNSEFFFFFFFCLVCKEEDKEKYIILSLCP